MPRGDGTGPGGMGPMSGRGAGYCAGYQVPGYANPGGGRGFAGRGRGGFGRGWRNGGFMPAAPGWGGAGWYAPPVQPVQPPAPVQETAALKNQIRYMEEELQAARERMTQLEQQEKPEGE